MLNKFLLGAAASLTALVALPAAAQADPRDRYYDDGGYYDRSYDDGYYRNSEYRDGYRRYRRGDYYGQGYARRGYQDAYYGRNYGRRGYQDDYYRGRCGDGTTGAIVGGAAGALLGREIARDGRSYSRRSYRRGGSGTVGAIVGGAVGAMVGREIDRSC